MVSKTEHQKQSSSQMIQMPAHITLILLLLLLVPISYAAPEMPSPRNHDLLIAIEEMQRDSYFAFAMLINLSPPDLFQGNLTFLMPKDRELSRTVMPENAVSEFVLRHSIPSPLTFQNLRHLPSGSILPSLEHNYTLTVMNNGLLSFFLNNVRVVSPNICRRASSIRCHGIDSVLSARNDPTMLPSPNCSSCIRPKSPEVPVGPPFPSWRSPPSPPPPPPFHLNTTPAAKQKSGASEKLLLSCKGMVVAALVFLFSVLGL